MGLFDKIRGKKKDEPIEPYVEFSNWLNKHLSEELPNNIVAVNFNLYEGSENTYDIELVGCGSFYENDEDWACDEVFTTREDLLFIPRTNDIAQWKQGLSFITAFVKRYLHDGEYASKLKSYTAVGIGFVDGNIDILYRHK